jgi:hypothetical protein
MSNSDYIVRISLYNVQNKEKKPMQNVELHIKF